MKINSTQNTSAVQNSKASKRTSSGAFALPEEQSVADTAPLNKTASLSNIDALLALQMVDDINPDARSRRRKAVAHGGQVLDALETLKIGLLSGALSKDQLLSLKQLLEVSPDLPEGPNLIDILKQIDLRAQVELAKLGIF